MSSLILAPEPTAFAWQQKLLPDKPIKLQQGFYDFEECLFEAPKPCRVWALGCLLYDDTLRIQHSANAGFLLVQHRAAHTALCDSSLQGF